MDQTIATFIVGAIVTVLGMIYRFYRPIDPQKSWLEMGLSIVGAIVGLFALGKLSLTPGLLADPVKAIQFVLENAVVIFAFSQVIYNALRQQKGLKNGFIIKALGCLSGDD